MSESTANYHELMGRINVVRADDQITGIFSQGPVELSVMPPYNLLDLPANPLARFLVQPLAVQMSCRDVPTFGSYDFHLCFVDRWYIEQHTPRRPPSLHIEMSYEDACMFLTGRRLFVDTTSVSVRQGAFGALSCFVALIRYPYLEMVS
jgi:hypothetical protein